MDEPARPPGLADRMPVEVPGRLAPRPVPDVLGLRVPVMLARLPPTPVPGVLGLLVPVILARLPPTPVPGVPVLPGKFSRAPGLPGAVRACRPQSVLRCTLLKRCRLPALILRFITPRLMLMAL